jgi:hypothetical protein
MVQRVPLVKSISFLSQRMKIIKPRFDLIFWFFPTFLIIAILTYNFSFATLMQVAKTNWLFDLIVLFLLCCPTKNFHFEAPRVLTPIQWPLSLFAVQLVLNLFFWGFLHFVYSQFVNSETPPLFNILQFSFGNGLFPFGFMMLVTATLGFFTYFKKNSGTVASAYVNFFGNNDFDSIGVTVNTYMRLLNFFVITFALSLCTIVLIYSIHLLTGIPFLRGLNLDVILVCCILILLSSNQELTKLLHQLMNLKIHPLVVPRLVRGIQTSGGSPGQAAGRREERERKLPLLVIILGFSVVLSISYLVLGIIVSFFSKFNSYPDITFLVFDTQYINDYLRVIVTFAWLGFAVLAGAIIAGVSRSYSLRAIILMSLATNLASWVVIYLFEQFTVSNGMIIMALCSLVILLFLMREKNVTYVMRATVPNAIIKSRSYFSLMKVLPIVLTSFVTSYATMGIFFLGLAAVLVLLPCLVMVLISFVGFIKES